MNSYLVQHEKIEVCQGRTSATQHRLMQNRDVLLRFKAEMTTRLDLASATARQQDGNVVPVVPLA